MADGELPHPPPHPEVGIKPLLNCCPKPITTSFAEIVRGSTKADPPFLDPSSVSFNPVSIYNGNPSVVFKASEKKSLLVKLPFVLVGKFSHGRPNLDSIKAFLAKLMLKGDVNVSLFDNKHLFIECESISDYYKLWLKLCWFINGKPMRILKWEPNFSPSKESPIAPVWVRFEGIPLYMFDEKVLLSISNSIGKPIKVSPLNVNRRILNSAKVCVELDVSKPLIDSIWVVFEEDESNVMLDGFLVRVYYDVLPDFCLSCLHLGHNLEACKLKVKGENAQFVKMEEGVKRAGQVFDKSSDSTLAQSELLEEIARAETATVASGMLVADVVLIENEVSHSAILASELEVGSRVEAEQHEKPHPGESNILVEESGGFDGNADSLELQIGGAERADTKQQVDGLSKHEEATFAHAVQAGSSSNLQPTVSNDKRGVEQHKSEAGVKDTVTSYQHCLSLDDANKQIDQLTRKSPVAAKNAEKQAEATEKKDGQIVGPSKDQVIEKRAEISRDISSIGFSTPEKGCNFTNVSTPSSWADQVEEEERQDKERNTTSKSIPQLISQELIITGANNSAIDSTVATYPDNGVIQTTKKVPTKKFHSDLPIDFDPMMCNKDDATEEISWSQLISGSIKLVARRSVSPVGRSSEKLNKLRTRVDFLDHDAGKTIMFDKEEYFEENEEFFKVVYHRPHRGRDNGTQRGRGRRRGRGRGFGRGYGPGRFMGRGRTREERTIIC